MDLGLTRRAPEVLVVGGLDARLSDAVLGGVALLAQLLQLGGRDLPHMAEQLRRGRLGVVGAEVRLADTDALELGRVLIEVIDLVPVHASLERDRLERIVRALADLRLDAGERHVQDL